MREKARAAALFFWRSFHEVRFKNFKTFLLGARRAGVCVLALVVLLSGLSIPAYAEFGGTDSTNLANLTTYTRSIWDYIRVTLQSHLSNIYSRLGTMVTHLQSIANDASASASRLLDISNRLTSLSNSLLSRLDAIIDSLGSSSYGSYALAVGDSPFTSGFDGWDYCLVSPDSGGSDFSAVRGDGSTWTFPSGSVGDFWRIIWSYDWSPPSDLFPYLASGTYYRVSFDFYGTFESVGNIPGLVKDSLSWSTVAGHTTVTYLLYFDVIQNISTFSINLNGSLAPGPCSFSIVAVDSAGVDAAYSGAVNPGQDAANQQLQDNVGQLENFDNKIFTDVSDYTSQLDFGLGDWSEAAAGISYIGSIFMLIWDNSPTQVIVLSLMVGLCLLILGRGPRVAGEVRRHEERASRRKKGG